MNQWRKDIASWRVGKILHLSIPFTWMLPAAREIAIAHKGKVIAGGPAVALAKYNGCDDLSWAVTPDDDMPYDALAFHNPLATFTTRGCPNKCPFCAVPKIEGEFRELKKWRPAPVVCDNNLLAASRSHFKKVLTSLRHFPAVDFNQGLDACLFTLWHADELSRLKGHVKIRFSFDDLPEETQVHDAVELCRLHRLTDIGIYCLIGFGDSPEDARLRLDLVRSWGIWPNAMRYQPLDALEKNSYVAPGWTEGQLRKMMHYYNHLRWYEHIPYDDFERYPYRETGKDQCELFA